MKIVKELAEIAAPTSLHPRRRAVVMLRDDGHFTFAEQYHHTSEHGRTAIAEGWASLRPEGIFATADEGGAKALAMLSRPRGG